MVATEPNAPARALSLGTDSKQTANAKHSTGAPDFPGGGGNAREWQRWEVGLVYYRGLDRRDGGYR